MELQSGHDNEQPNRSGQFREGRRVKRWIDLPPVWLAGGIAVAWLQSTRFSFGLSFGEIGADFVGGLLVGGGVLLMLLAVYEMRRQKTTVMPHETPSRIVQSGIFSRSRNPIYLGDVLILAGLVLRFDAVLCLPLVPILLWVLEKRFVIPEENRMRRTFRMDWARYEQKVRRWV
ncbi:isoprenylcysteine carboxylmethyltransferase family protein [Rhodobacteraceae bacterium M382]|nr:isoprenylcysteine carboxylmethyltransferase family protein [Rhodobacteraceae bacterium M382]